LPPWMGGSVVSDSVTAPMEKRELFRRASVRQARAFAARNGPLDRFARCGSLSRAAIGQARGVRRSKRSSRYAVASDGPFRKTRLTPPRCGLPAFARTSPGRRG
jgi:hypothetical protein